MCGEIVISIVQFRLRTCFEPEGEQMLCHEKLETQRLAVVQLLQDELDK